MSGRTLSAAAAHYLRCATFPAGVYPLTVAGWFRTAATGYERIFTWDAANIPMVSSGLTNYPGAGYLANQTSTGPLAYSSNTFSVNTWNHFACQATSTAATIWLNGVATTGGAGFPPNPAGSTNFVVGTYYAGSGQFFSGDVMDLAVWNATLLTEQEILLLRGGRSPDSIQRASLTAWYFPRGERRGDRDFSGAGRDLTPYNSPTWGDDPPQTIQRRRRRVGVAAAPTGNRRRRLLCRAG